MTHRLSAVLLRRSHAGTLQAWASTSETRPASLCKTEPLLEIGLNTSFTVGHRVEIVDGDNGLLQRVTDSANCLVHERMLLLQRDCERDT